MAMNFWKKLEEAGVQGDPEPVDLLLYVNFGAFVPTSAPPAPQASITAASLTNVRPNSKEDSPDSGITTRDFSGTVCSTVGPPDANKTTHADNVAHPDHPDFDDRKPSAVKKAPDVPLNTPDGARVSWRGRTVHMSRPVPSNQFPLGTPVVRQRSTHPPDAHGIPNAGNSTRTSNLRTSGEDNTGAAHRHGARDHHGDDEDYDHHGGDDDYDDYNHIRHDHPADHGRYADDPSRPAQQRYGYRYTATTARTTPRTPLTGQMTLERFLAQQQLHPYNSKNFSCTTNIPVKHPDETWLTWYVRFSLHGLLHGVFIPPWESFAKDEIYGAWYGYLPPAQLHYIHGLYGLLIQTILCQKGVLPDDSEEWRIARTYTDGYEILYAIMTPYHPLTRIIPSPPSFPRKRLANLFTSFSLAS